MKDDLLHWRKVHDVVFERSSQGEDLMKWILMQVSADKAGTINDFHGGGNVGGCQTVAKQRLVMEMLEGVLMQTSR